MDYTSDYDYDSFSNDSMCIDAVLRNFEIIGEAAGKIPSEVRDKHPDVPWRRMIGLRNIVSHEYFGIDYSIIWQIIKTSLPELLTQIEEIRKNLG